MIKRNAFFNLILSLSQVLFPLITFPYVSRILGPEGIGAISFVDSFTAIFMLISILGIPIYGVREIAKVKNNSKKLSKLFIELTIIHLISQTIFCCVFIGISFIVPGLKNLQQLVFIGIVTMVSNIFISEWFFQGIEEFSYITKRTLLVRIIFIILMFILVKKHSDAYIYYGLTSLSFLLNAISNLLYVRKKIIISFNNLELKKHIKPLLIILGTNLAISIYLLIDVSILGLIKGNVVVGYYSTAVKITKISITVISALGVVLIPQISHAFKYDDYTKINLLINKSINYVSSLAVPICFGILLMAPFIIKITVGPKFYNSIELLQFLAPITLCIGLTNIFAWQILTPFGKDKTILSIVTLGMVINLTLNLILIPKLSSVGAAIVNVITEVFVMFMAFHHVRKLKKIKLSYRSLVNAIIGSIIFIPIIKLTNLLIVNENVQGVIGISTCTVFYMFYQVFIIKNDLAINYLSRFKKKVIINQNEN